MQNDSHWSVRLKWRMSRKKLEEQAGEGVQIGRLRHWSTLSLLGSHVFRRAQNRPGGRVVDRSRSAARDPEIGKRDAVPVANNDVGGLHIAMDNSSSMGIVHCGAHLFGDTERPGRGQRAILTQHIIEGRSPEELHHDILCSLDFTDIMDGDDVGVMQQRRRSRLGEEPLAESWLAGQPTRQDLERDLTAKTWLDGTIDDTHAAAADLGGNRKRPDLTSNERFAGHHTPWLGKLQACMSETRMCRVRIRLSRASRGAPSCRAVHSLFGVRAIRTGCPGGLNSPPAFRAAKAALFIERKGAHQNHNR
jgi:hypothetical protein